jgi:predicted dehydrogenase
VGATVYPDGAALLAEVPLDALIITTPPAIRQSLIEVAAARHVALFTEKPLALELSAARACCAAVAEASVLNAVGFHLRYSPLTQRAQTLLAGKQITHVRTACTTYHYLKMNMPIWMLQREYSGGPLLDQAIHVLDAARYLAGDITHISGSSDRLVRPDLPSVNADDTLVLAYRFASGALGTHIDSCAMQEFNFEVELFGSDWRLRVDYARSRLSGYIQDTPIDEPMPDSHLHAIEIAAFLDAVRHHEQSLLRSDFVDATKTLATMLAGNRSLDTHTWEAFLE